MSFRREKPHVGSDDGEVVVLLDNRTIIRTVDVPIPTHLMGLRSSISTEFYELKKISLLVRTARM